MLELTVWDVARERPIDVFSASSRRADSAKNGIVSSEISDTNPIPSCLFTYCVSQESL